MKDTEKVSSKLFQSFSVTIPALCVIFLQYISIGRPQDIFAPIRVLHLGAIAIVLVVLVALFRWRSVDGPGMSGSSTVVRFRNVVILMLMLVPFSVVPAKAINFIITNFSFVILYFLCFCHFVRSFKALKLSMLVMIFSAFAFAVSMIISRSYDGIRVATGTMYDPNDIALFFVSIVPLAIGYARISKGLLRIFCGTTVFLSLYSIALTQSRGAFIGLIVLLFAWLFQPSKQGHKREMPKKAAAIVAIVLFAWILFPQQFWSRMETIRDGNTTSSGRMTVWPRALTMMTWHPLGVGPGSFTTVYGRYLSAGRFPSTEDIARERAWMTVHNSYLLVGVELGLLGLVLYLIWLVGMMRTLSRLKALVQEKALNKNLSQHCSTVQLSLLGFMVPAVFLSQSYSYILITLAGYVVALERIVMDEIGE